MKDPMAEVDKLAGQAKDLNRKYGTKNAKISKITIWPSRKVNLGNYETVDLNAGIETTFEKPVDFNSKEIEEALIKMRKVVDGEFRKQFDAFKPKKREVNKMTKDVIIFTKDGKAIRVPINEFPKQSRGGMGIKAINLQQGNEVVAVVSIEE